MRFFKVAEFADAGREVTTLRDKIEHVILSHPPSIRELEGFRFMQRSFPGGAESIPHVFQEMSHEDRLRVLGMVDIARWMIDRADLIERNCRPYIHLAQTVYEKMEPELDEDSNFTMLEHAKHSFSARWDELQSLRAEVEEMRGRWQQALKTISSLDLNT